MRIASLSCLLISLATAWSQTLPLEPSHESGASVTGAFEGWFQNADGSYGLLLGYFNRNLKQELDIPIGPDNRIEPGGPDRGQPTHFLAGRQWGMFVINVPKDFGDQKLTWTIVANGQTTTIPVSLKTDYEINPFQEAAVGNTPPVLRLDERGPEAQGPRPVITERSARVGVPLTLTIWASDDAKLTSSSGAVPRYVNLATPVTLHWTKYRGPGTVTFGEARPKVEKVEGKGANARPFNGKSTTTATFSEAGIYVLHVMANDYSGEGGGGFQCCWTTSQVQVSVQP